MKNTEIIDCTTCKYGYEDERLGIPMCHHPKRFSEDCVNFNMHEEKETEESEKPVPNGLEEAADNHIRRVADAAGHPGWDWTTQDIADAFIAGAKWQAEKDARDMYMSDNRHFEKVYQLGKKDMKEQMLNDAVEGEVYKLGEVAYVKECNNSELTKYLSQFNNGDRVKIIVIHETDIR